MRLLPVGVYVLKMSALKSMTLKLAEMDLPALIDFPLAINPRFEKEKPADIDFPSTSATVLLITDDWC